MRNIVVGALLVAAPERRQEGMHLFGRNQGKADRNVCPTRTMFNA
jgi:hypothetical protein